MAIYATTHKVYNSCITTCNTTYSSSSSLLSSPKPSKLYSIYANSDAHQSIRNNTPWLSVPQFGNWDQKGVLPDYSLDFSKIREMRKQNKRDVSRASIGNEEELISSATATTIDTSHSDHHHHHQNHSPTVRFLDSLSFLFFLLLLVVAKANKHSVVNREVPIAEALRCEIEVQKRLQEHLEKAQKSLTLDMNNTISLEATGDSLSNFNLALSNLMVNIDGESRNENISEKSLLFIQRKSNGFLCLGEEQEKDIKLKVEGSCINFDLNTRGSYDFFGANGSELEMKKTLAYGS
ncbi:Myb family transcription factor PHL11 [Camellia lanceoleosa]|uniref:Myb family transcription factor PHL11 n=1 Tax=Camellia lanceoleosa TaxID=1840588 RepID=A0ACC0IA60_9ERIC|nr:Myb family transcription factor PHL11 [Camellia lanceoleosa]